MPFFPSLPEGSGVRKIWELSIPRPKRGFPSSSVPYMRNEGKLMLVDKEMISAYVSEA
jgi:hypothetical protein